MLIKPYEIGNRVVVKDRGKERLGRIIHVDWSSSYPYTVLLKQGETLQFSVDEFMAAGAPLFQDFMVDLETMSVAPNAAIASIGIVRFDEFEVMSKLYVSVDVQSCEKRGLDIDPVTVKWWREQSEEAQKALDGGVDLQIALSAVDKFVRAAHEPRVWGNGAPFDNVILRSAYKACGLLEPWQFYNDRCFRTMKTMHPIDWSVRRGVHHHALDDAITQTEHLQKICEVHGVTLR